jgi:hypothetical protein
LESGTDTLDAFKSAAAGATESSVPPTPTGGIVSIAGSTPSSTGSPSATNSAATNGAEPKIAHIDGSIGLGLALLGVALVM